MSEWHQDACCLGRHDTWFSPEFEASQTNQEGESNGSHHCHSWFFFFLGVVPFRSIVGFAFANSSFFVALSYTRCSSSSSTTTTIKSFLSLSFQSLTILIREPIRCIHRTYRQLVSRLAICQSQEASLVAGVGSIGDQLPQEHILV